MTTSFSVCNLCILLLTSGFTLFAQEKVEVERAVDASEVPSDASAWLGETYPNAVRVQWYFEQTSGETSYEAKLKQAGQWHSVEFSEDGTLQDIEITSRWRALPDSARQAVSTYLDTTYTKYHIRKIQRQLTGPPKALQQAVRNTKVHGITERYEIEFYGNDGQEKLLWEGLFDDAGQLIKKRRIVLRPIDNLIY